MTRVRLLDETKTDLALAWEFYEAQEQGAGDYFFQRVDEALGELEWTPGTHPVRYSYFAAPVPRFPYSIFYRKSDEDITIMGIFDQRSDPALIRAQLRDR